MIDLLNDGCIGDDARREDLLAQRFEYLAPIVVKVAVDLVNRLRLDDPQLAVGVADQTFVVRHDDHSCEERDLSLVICEGPFVAFIFEGLWKIVNVLPSMWKSFIH